MQMLRGIQLIGLNFYFDLHGFASVIFYSLLSFGRSIYDRILQIKECASIGRYVKSTRDIKTGEIILREKPLIFGPKIISVPVCLGCHQNLKPIDIQVNAAPSPLPGNRKRNQKPKVKTLRNYYKCSTCKWPLCSRECEKSPAHLDECQLMAERNFQCSIDYNAQDEQRKESAYCAILPLRCLMQKKINANG